MLIHEVGPRDGLQGHSIKLSVKERVDLIRQLNDAGINHIEFGAFVHPKRVPNMADSDKVYQQLNELSCEFSVLIPNKHGFEKAKELGIKKVNIFFSCSNEFNQRNLGKNMEEIIEEFKEMLKDTPKENVRVYISTIFGCPYLGIPSDDMVINAVEQASQLGDTIVLCDTIGSADINTLAKILDLVKDYNISLHLHGENLLDKVEIAYEKGVREFDSSIHGLGGCPFMPNTKGNLSTENLVDWAHKRGIETNIDINKLKNIHIPH